MSKALVIRADANTRMGTGHVMRCIALGQAWQDAGGTVTFVTCCDSDAVKQRVRDEGFGLHELSEIHPQSDADLRSTLDILRDCSASWLVTDGYHFDLAYQQAVRHAGIKLLYIDDYAHLDRYEADILLNQNISAPGLAYRINEECVELHGLEYALLRREFRRIEPRSNVADPIRNFLISFGGSDPDNVTSRSLAGLRHDKDHDIHIKILVGPSNPHLQSILSEVRRLPPEIEVLSCVEDMPSLITWADFAITAAGSTCWELAAFGVPFATAVIASNQEGIASALKAVLGVPSLGWPDPHFPDRVEELVSAVTGGGIDLERCRANLVRIVDRQGTDRLLKEITAR